MGDAFIKILADGAVIPVVIIAGYMLIARVPNNHKLRIYSNILIAGLLAYFIAKLMSTLYQPVDGRPFEALGLPAGASFLNNPGFPSDHALFVTAITAAVWYATRNRIVTIILAGLVVVVCVGRVLALVHTVEDVVFGVICALIGALWYLNDKTTYLPQKQKK